MSHVTRLTAIAALTIGIVAVTAPEAGASGGKPTQERGRVVETFADDFLHDLCGIDTTTTMTQHFNVTTFPDGSQLVHETRTFVSADPRVPIEKGAGTSHWTPDGVQTVTGTPIHLISDHGTVLLDAGRVTFADELDVRGPHPSLFVPSLAPYYCPWLN
jgi:hypothetical protein